MIFPLQNSLETTLEVVVSGIDEFLVEIHANVIALIQNELFFRIAIMSKLYYTLF